jgi:hypothetical protein
MHQMENLLVQCKVQEKIPKPHIDFFLRGIDAAKSNMADQTVQFNYSITQTPTQAPVIERQAQPVSTKVIPIERKKNTKENHLGLVVVVDVEKDNS